MLEHACQRAIQKASLRKEDINFFFSGDLMNQIISSSFTARTLGVPFLGIFGACSSSMEGLSLAAQLIDSNSAKYVVAAASSHNAAAEKQFRYPTEYGVQRPPTAQWTVTGAGACVLGPNGDGPKVTSATIGRVVDMGISDPYNVGAAMAPAAFSTISTFFTDTGMTPSDFDYIVTGDLGKVGSRILCELFERENINIRDNHKDCGMMLYDFDEQDIHAGGSGCGCAGSVLCGYFLPKLRAGEIKNILFAATGALMSPTVNQQGESIPSISHLVWLSGEKDMKGAN